MFLAVDVRSIALFRIALGALLLAFDLRWADDYSSFFSPEGLGVGDRMTWLWIFWTIPVLAVCLTVGFAARVASAFSLMAVCMVQHAAPQILQGGDQMLRVLLCWGVLLPIEACWSVDRRIGLSVIPGRTSSVLITACYTLQIVCVYWFAALLKSGPEWRETGDALTYVLHIEHFTTPLGTFLAHYPNVLRPMTFAALALEFLGPFLLLIPSKGNRLLGVAVVIFVGFHVIGMQILLRIALFPWACAVAWLPFIPAVAWNWLAGRLRSPMWMVLPAEPASRKRRAQPVKEWMRWLSYGAGAGAVLAALDVLFWNVSGVPGSPRIALHPFGPALAQGWDMYAPFPRHDHGWLIVQADLPDGSQFDLYTGKAITWDKPKDLGAYFGDDLWRRYISNLFDQRNPDDLRRYAEWLVRAWDRGHSTDQQVQAVSIVYMQQVTQADLSDSAPQKITIFFKTLD